MIYWACEACSDGLAMKHLALGADFTWILLGSKHLHRSNILFDSFSLSHSSNKFSVFGFSGNLSLFWFKTSFNLF